MHAKGLDAFELLKKAEKKDKGGSTLADISISYYNSGRFIRDISVYLVEKQVEDTRINLFIAMYPEEIKGTSYLFYTSRNAPNEYFAYLPALKESLINITGPENKLSFFATKINIEDLTPLKARHFHNRIVGSGDYMGYKTIIVESVPKTKGDSNYSRIIQWISPEMNIALKREFVSKNKKSRKTLSVPDIEFIDGIWSVKKMRMEAGSRQFVIDVHNIGYNMKLDTAIFDHENIPSFTREVEDFMSRRLYFE